MQTMDMTPGDLLYRLTRGRDPPWNCDAARGTARGTVFPTIYRRPERIIEWLHALSPLAVRFCSCGLLREISWSRGWVCRMLYPKGPVFYVGCCPACGQLAEILDRLNVTRCKCGLPVDQYGVHPESCLDAPVASP